MKRFRAIFSDAGELTEWNIRALNAEHAELRFWEAIDEFGGSEGIRLISITLAPRLA
jgi:hypothetical protein